MVALCNILLFCHHCLAYLPLCSVDILLLAIASVKHSLLDVIGQLVLESQYFAASPAVCHNSSCFFQRALHQYLLGSLSEFLL